VEALMHALYPARFVCHTHPTLLNALGCAAGGPARARELFGADLMWIESINPGWTLARRMADEAAVCRAQNGGKWPEVTILQNHGLVVWGESSARIAEVHARVESALLGALPRAQRDLVAEWQSEAGRAVLPWENVPSELGEIANAVARTAGVASGVVLPFVDATIRPFLTDKAAFGALDGALTPDHIVYAGHQPLWVGSDSTGDGPSGGVPSGGGSTHADAWAARVRDAHAAFTRVEGASPRVAVLQGLGCLAFGATQGMAEAAALLFRDAARIVKLTPAFGGTLWMAPAEVVFIRNWEVERFRQQEAAGK
jgi:rhamnose utilization protein RhaD (predicted bifunctional aldolase and dehydrogenase)